MPLMDGVPSRPERAGPAKVIATAIDIVARAVVSALRHCGSLSFLRKQESLCSALVPCFRRDDGGLLLASSKRWGGQALVRRLGCEREARERPMDGRRSDFRGHGWSSEWGSRFPRQASCRQPGGLAVRPDLSGPTNPLPTRCGRDTSDRLRVGV